MATKKKTATRKTSTSGKKKSRSKSTRKRTTGAPEPMPARVLQSLILVVGVMLLFAVFFPGRTAPIIIGAMIFGSAFPPVRRYVDKWLTGKTRGEEANQAAVLRMGLGVAIAVLTLILAP